jgi:hypothetical protein
VLPLWYDASGPLDQDAKKVSRIWAHSHLRRADFELSNEWYARLMLSDSRCPSTPWADTMTLFLLPELTLIALSQAPQTILPVSSPSTGFYWREGQRNLSPGLNSVVLKLDADMLGCRYDSCHQAPAFRRRQRLNLPVRTRGRKRIGP